MLNIPDWVQRRYIEFLNLKNTFTLECVKQNYDASKESITLISMVRNERWRLGHFIEHYKKIGVDNFIFIDNCSSDDTVSFLSEYDAVSIFSYTSKYSSLLICCAIQSLIDLFGHNKWYVLVDADELAVFSQIEKEYTLKHLVRYAQQKQIRQIRGVLVDMYADGGFEKYLSLNSIEEVLTACCFFDAEGYRHRFDKYISPARGGVRQRMLHDLGISEQPPLLSKFPLRFFDDECLFLSPHCTWPYSGENSDSLIGLKHYKFSMQDIDKISDALQNEQYYMQSMFYKYMADWFAKHPHQSLLSSISRRYSSSQDFVNARLIADIDFESSNQQKKNEVKSFQYYTSIARGVRNSDPQINRQEVNELYERLDSMARAEESPYSISHEIIANELKELMQKHKLTGVVGEIGCKSDRLRRYMPEHEFCYLSLYPDPESSESVLLADITYCPDIPDEYFDVIVSVSCFAHFSNPFKAAREIMRILKPGGITYHYTPFSSYYHKAPIDFWRYSKDAFEYLFKFLEPLRVEFNCGARRRNFIGSSLSAIDKFDPLFQIDAFGGWRENWFVTYIGRKTPGWKEQQLKKSMHQLIIDLGRVQLDKGDSEDLLVKNITNLIHFANFDEDGELCVLDEPTGFSLGEDEVRDIWTGRWKNKITPSYRRFIFWDMLQRRSNIKQT